MIWHIARKELIEITRDKKNIILNILFPILMVLIIVLIAVISNIYKGEQKKDLIPILTTSPKIAGIIAADKIYEVTVVKNLETLQDAVTGNQAELGISEAGQQITFFQKSEEQSNPYYDVLKSELSHKLQLSFQNIQLQSLDTRIVNLERDNLVMVLKVVGVVCAFAGIILGMRINNSYAFYITTKEKSSGTLEWLLTTPVRPLDIILGKWCAITLTCFFSTMLIFMPLYLFLASIFDIFLKYHLGLFLKLPLVVAELLVFALVFSLIQLLLGFLAGSTKQAQVYLVYIPLILMLPLALTFTIDIQSLQTYSPGIRILDFIPGANIYESIQMAMFSQWSIVKLLIIGAVNSIAVLLMLYNLVRTFKQEKILFFDH